MHWVQLTLLVSVYSDRFWRPGLSLTLSVRSVALEISALQSSCQLASGCHSESCSIQAWLEQFFSDLIQRLALNSSVDPALWLYYWLLPAVPCSTDEPLDAGLSDFADSLAGPVLLALVCESDLRVDPDALFRVGFLSVA